MFSKPRRTSRSKVRSDNVRRTRITNRFCYKALKRFPLLSARRRRLNKDSKRTCAQSSTKHGQNFAKAPLPHGLYFLRHWNTKGHHNTGTTSPRLPLHTHPLPTHLLLLDPPLMSPRPTPLSERHQDLAILSFRSDERWMMRHRAPLSVLTSTPLCWMGPPATLPPQCQHQRLILALDPSCTSLVSR